MYTRGDYAMKKINKTQLSKIKELALLGKGVVEIANTLSVSQPTVSKYMKELGFNTSMTISDECVDVIVAKYNKGVAINVIAKELGISRPTVRKYLQQEVNIPKKCDLVYGEELSNKIVSMYEAGFSMSYIARELNISNGGISKLLKRIGVSKRVSVVREINEEFKGVCYEHPDYVKEFMHSVDLGKANSAIAKIINFFYSNTAESAYWLGFIYADGCVSIKSNKVLSIALNSLDRPHLERFCDVLGLPKTKIRDTQRVVKGIAYNASELQISSKYLCKALIECGVVPNKSLVLKPPSLDIVPYEFIRDFIRGYIDGDGTIFLKDCKVVNVTVLGTYDMIDWISEYFFNIIGDKARTKLSQKDFNINTFSYRINGSNALSILKHIYYDGAYALERKLSLVKTACSCEKPLEKDWAKSEEAKS